jgi:heme-degrading monooxygenase HmoA
MVARHWTGVTKPGKADDYIAHLKNETFPQLSSIPGFIKASILHRDLQEGTEFLIITEWESLGSIHAFAGEDATKAVVPPAVREMMMHFDDRVRHYSHGYTT